MSENLGMQNNFTTTLSQAISDSDLTIYVEAVPTASEGYLVIEDETSNREIIRYTSKTGNAVICPSTNGRGVGGTSAKSHEAGASVDMNFVAEYWNELQDGSALADNSIAPEKLQTSVLGYVQRTTELSLSTSATTQDVTDMSVTFTIPGSVNRRVKATFQAYNFSGSVVNVNTQLYFAFGDNNVFGGHEFRSHTTAGFTLPLGSIVGTTELAPGTHTIKMRVRSASAMTTTFGATTTTPIFLLLEIL